MHYVEITPSSSVAVPLDHHTCTFFRATVVLSKMHLARNTSENWPFPERSIDNWRICIRYLAWSTTRVQVLVLHCTMKVNLFIWVSEKLILKAGTNQVKELDWGSHDCEPSAPATELWVTSQVKELDWGSHDCEPSAPATELWVWSVKLSVFQVWGIRTCTR